MASTPALSWPARRPVLADLLPGDLVRDVLLVAAAAGFVGLLAQISFPLPGTPVPVTGQTLGVLVAGCALGWARASLASCCYVGLGFLGVPWFAGHAAGWAGATSGYLFGFVVASLACGLLARRGADRSLAASLATMLVGECCIFGCGVGFLAADLDLPAGRALALGLTPFLAGEAVKLVLAGGLLPAAWRLAGPRRAGPPGAAAQGRP